MKKHEIIKRKNRHFLKFIALLIMGCFLFAACDDLLDNNDDNGNDNDHGENGADYETGTMTDNDGNVYETVFIGGQEWMAENLRVTSYNNGAGISANWTHSVGAYTVYPHDGTDLEGEEIEGIESPGEMAAAYGKLYNWFAVNDQRGLCPSGWRVPDEEDVIELIDYLEEQGYANNPNAVPGAADALKSCRQVGSPLGGNCDTPLHPRWNYDERNHGINVFGFSALPGGDVGSTGAGDNFANIGKSAYFWTSTEHSGEDARYWRINYMRGSIDRNYNFKQFGFSVRCVRNVNK